jgi:hypothetical protein
MTSTNIIEILSEHGGSIKLSQLRAHLRGFNVGSINRIIKRLENEGEIILSGNTIILVPTSSAEQMLLHGNENEDGSIEPTGHNQVSIPYDKTLFRVVDESHKLLDEITVDEGMVELLKAIWRHRLPTVHSCQGTEGDTAWIRFMWHEDVSRFLDLVPQSRNAEHWKLSFIKAEKNYQVSFPPEDIARITEELNSKPIG